MRSKFLVASAAVASVVPMLSFAPGPASASVSPQAVAHRNVPLCPSPPRGYGHCHAIVREAITAAGKPVPDATTSPTGMAPATYMQAYGWANATNARLIGDGTGQTIAVVDAYDDPTIASDLSYFSTYFNIPCNSCFTKVNQTGGSSYPSVNSNWALEIALDVEWAHAIAPNASILLVEATSASYSDLFSAEDYASAHAHYVTNSWGGSESSGESSYDSHFSTAGVSYFASSGDTGGAVEYPSASPNVTSVGGTTLTSSSGTWTETGWSSSGGGCSAYEKANASQVTKPNVTCSGRATPDVASDADPNTGVDVYDTTSYNGQSGWFQVGGTSAASPVWAARAADRGAQVNAAYEYAGYDGTATTWGTNITYRDVTSGSNGYSAGFGYDLVTGIGTWIGGDSTGGGGGGGGSTVAAPTNLATSVSGTNVTLTWGASTTSGVTYNVYRSSTSGTETSNAPIATGITTTSYVDGSVAPGTYYYEVTASTTSGGTIVSSSPSNEASASITAPAITADSCNKATCSFSGTGSGTLSWNFGDNSPGATGSSVSHTYQATGTFHVTLTNGVGSAATATVSCGVGGKGKHTYISCSSSTP